MGTPQRDVDFLGNRRPRLWVVLSKVDIDPESVDLLADECDVGSILRGVAEEDLEASRRRDARMGLYASSNGDRAG